MSRSLVISVCCLLGLVLFGLLSSVIFQEDGGLAGYSYGTISISDKGLAPFSSSAKTGHFHLFGTDKLGRDTLAGIGNGLKVATGFALLAALLAAAIGALIAYFATYQYYRSTRIKLGYLIGGAIVVWYGLYLLGVAIVGSDLDFTFFTISYLALLVLVWRETARHNGHLSMDEASLKLIEVWKTIPLIMVVIIFSSIVTSINYVSLAIIIAFLLWPTYTRLIRGELIKLSKQDFVKSAMASGATHRHIYFQHLLPNTIAPLVAKFCFSLISIILLESTLSFLGIGIPVDQVSLGSMIKESTDSMSYWWMAVFPGMTLMVLLLSLNTIGSWYLKKQE